MNIKKLTCEYRKNPLGIDTPSPRLSWQLSGSKRGLSQTAYRILVSDCQDTLNMDVGNIWDSKKVRSSQSIFVPYSGAKLQSGKKFFWKVKVWDQDGQETTFSESASWQMGILKNSEWKKAIWIGKDKDPKSSLAQKAPYFRKEFSLKKKVKAAYAFICGVGYNELYINGKKAGENRLDPGFTRFDKRVLYTTYDITELLKDQNTFGVVLGNGFYNSLARDAWDFESAPWRNTPRFILKTIIEFTDGSSQEVVSDTSWKVGNGPIIFNYTRNGEFYDARKEIPGWNKNGFNDKKWQRAKKVPAPTKKIISQYCQPIKITEEINPIAITEPKPGIFLVDMGQNIAGWCRLKVSGTSGKKIILRHGEKLDQAGMLDNSDIDTLVNDGEFQTDKYILKGKGKEIWEPRFVYHGFRYVEVKGFPGKLKKDTLTACFAHTSFESNGKFSCSNSLFNKIQEVTLRSYKSNFHSIPTDCPQREKNGWTGDAHLAAEAGIFNFDAAPAYTKWLDDFVDAILKSGKLPGIVPTGTWGYDWGNGPAWDSAYLLISWYMYLYKGDLGILEKHYEKFKRYIHYLEERATPQGIVNLGLGDWVPPYGQPDDGPIPRSMSSTAYYYKDTVIVAKAAELLGKKKDHKKFSKLAEKIKTDFNKMFYNSRTGSYSNNTQTTQSCALYQGLVPEGEESKVLKQLINTIDNQNGYLNTGILGTKYIYHALTDNGRADLANKLANNKEYPSIGHWLKNGATSLYECWDGANSRNHIMFGDISAWFYETIGGINPDPENPGFKHVIIKPEVLKGVTKATTEHQSLYGIIKTQWQTKNGEFSLKLTIPANTTATVVLPVKSKTSVNESGKPITKIPEISAIKEKAGKVSFELTSGQYALKVKV